MQIFTNTYLENKKRMLPKYQIIIFHKKNLPDKLIPKLSTKLTPKLSTKLTSKLSPTTDYYDSALLGDCRKKIQIKSDIISTAKNITKRQTLFFVNFHG